MTLRTYRIHVLPVLVLGITSISPAASGEQPIQFRIYKGKGDTSQGAAIDKQFAAAEVELKTGLFDPAAETLFASAESYTKSVFPLSSLHLVKAVTLRDHGDTIVAEWSVTEPFATGSLAMEDTPVLSLYTFRLTNCAINNRDELSVFLTKLVAWSRPPLEIPPVPIDLPSDDQGLNQFSGSTMRAPTPALYDFVVHGARRGTEWLISVQIGKGMMGDVYPRPHFVAERFPPITELARSWTSDRINEEIGRPVDLKPHVMDFSIPRDEVLIAELCRRGLSADEFLRLLRANPGEPLRVRAQLVTAALRRAGDQARLTQYAGSAFDLYEQIGPGAADAVAVLFSAVSRPCMQGFEARALMFIRTGVFYDGALSHLAQCSSSPETLHRLESAGVPPQFMEKKEVTSRNIAGRISGVRALP